MPRAHERRVRQRRALVSRVQSARRWHGRRPALENSVLMTGTPRLSRAGVQLALMAEPDDETLNLCLGARARGAPLSFRHSLAATLCSDQLRADALPEPAGLALSQTLAEILTSRPSVPGQAIRRPP